MSKLHRKEQQSLVNRKHIKRNNTSIWINNINIGARNIGLTYNKVINLLKESQIIINKKMLSQLILNESRLFIKLIYNNDNKSNI
jgi:large subunit ribosomal protein L20